MQRSVPHNLLESMRLRVGDGKAKWGFAEEAAVVEIGVQRPSWRRPANSPYTSPHPL
jgi:hypothetical protein